MNKFDGIIDIYDGNDKIDLKDAWQRGVKAILHETSRGTYKKDKAYQDRKKEALDLGFLWSAYHLVSPEKVSEQLDFFLNLEDLKNPSIGMALDWEKTKLGVPSGDIMREFVTALNSHWKPQFSDRYPIVYGGDHLREDAGVKKGDELLGKCPLWYVFMFPDPLTNKKYPFPSKTWETYTLWQFDDENRHHGGPPTTVLPGADWNRFQGTSNDLSRAWPFGGVQGASATPLHPLTGEIIAPIAPPSGDFATRAVNLALQEWTFWGKQTYDVHGHRTNKGHTEQEPGWYQRVGKYWLEGVNVKGIDGRNTDWYWSAAFISWLMKTAGAGDRFHYSRQHSVYVAQAIHDYQIKREDAGYWGVRLGDEKPEAGDIVCWARQPGISYDDTHNGNYAGHCDLIVSIGNGTVDVIGGNVGNSVTRRPLPLDADGYVAKTTEGGEYLFALMKNRIV